jgi:peroxiredoxin Q/BCP
MHEPHPDVPGALRSHSFGKAIAIKLALVALVVGGSVLVSSSWWNRGSSRDLAQEAKHDLESRHFQPLSGSLQSLVSDPAYKPIPTQSHPLLGKPAPDFTLKDTDGNDWTLSQEIKKGPVVVVFYYGYHCSHCVSQLFGLAKDLDSFAEFGASVVALSSDPAETTRERYRKYGAFAFPVLCDPNDRVAEKFGAYTPSTVVGESGDLLHGTFLIGTDGKVLWANIAPEPFTENRTLLVQLHRARSGKPNE